MHPNRAFRFADDAAMRAFIAQSAFAHLFAMTPDGPMVAHVPLTPTHAGHFRFHVARHNRITPHLDGSPVLASVAGADFYVSPDWYAAPADQVPTWNYTAVEIDGTCHALSEADLVEQIDALSALHEAPLAPKKPWTRDKVSLVKLRSMYNVIEAFEIRVRALRGTHKMSQNKQPEDRRGVIAALTDPVAIAAMRGA